MTRKKANISPSLIGELFLKPGEDIPYRLILCNTEPTAQIQRVDRTTPDDLVGISGLRGLVLLKPVKPITKPPVPRKTRVDKGTKRVGKRLKPEPITVITPELREMEEGLNSEGLTLLKPAKKKGKKTSSKPDISTFLVTVGQKDKPHTLKLGEVAVSSLTLEQGVKELLGLCGIDRKFIEDAPESEGRKQLLDILNPTP